MARSLEDAASRGWAIARPYATWSSAKKTKLAEEDMAGRMCVTFGNRRVECALAVVVDRNVVSERAAVKEECGGSKRLIPAS